MTLFIRGGQLLLKSDAGWQLVRRNVWIEGETIREITPVGVAESCLETGTVIDAAGQIILPGLVNAHYHSHDNLVRATGSQLPLELWSLGPTGLRQDYSPREVFVSTLLGCAELLANGCTGVIDHVKLMPHLDPDGLAAVVAAYRIAGLRVVVAPVISDRPFPETLPLTAEEQATIGDVSGWSTMPASEQISRVDALIRAEDEGPGGRIRIGVGPSGPQRCTDVLLIEAARLANEFQTCWHTHALESRLQRAQIDRLYQSSLTAHLADLGVLGPNSQLVHLVWPTEEELVQVADSGAMVVHNPISNVYLGSGIAPVSRMVALNIPLALGSDSACCNHSHNMFETLKWAGMIHNLASPDPAHWLTPTAVLDMAIEGGAQALGLAHRGGAIAPGRLADLILIDADSPGLVPLNAPLQQLVYGAERARITKVIVGGQVIYNGRPLKFEVDQLYQEVRALAGDRLSRFGNNTADQAVAQTIDAAYRRQLLL